MRCKLFAIGLCLVGFAATLFAQQQLASEVRWNHAAAIPATAEDSVPLVLHRRVAEVAVHVAVSDRGGKPVAALRPDDLQVLDSGIPAAITELRREEALPLRVALVIDWSDSMQKNLRLEREVALQFLREVLRPETDQAMVVGFRYKVEVTQPLTSNLQDVEAGLRPVGGVGLSSVYDALIAATDRLRSSGPCLAERRAIVLLSDGHDNVSAHGLQDALEAAEEANITVYTVAPATPPARLEGRQVLTRLAGATGGRALFLARPTDHSALAIIARDLTAGYALYFKPSSGNSGLRPLEITARDKRLQVVARRSYYAGEE